MDHPDHRHLAIWLWTHSQSLTDNSETSIESSFSENSEFGRMGDSPHYHTSTSPDHRMLAACAPSTSFANLDLNQHVLSSSFLASLPPALMRHPPPPPPYTPRAHPTHATLLRMHKSPVNIDVDTDVDVVGLSDSTRGVCLNDRISEDQPLDLSMKKTSPIPRPSVIIGGTSSSSIRRSASNVTPTEPDVRDHFRRSLSGKWPKKNKNETDKGRASPFRRHTTQVNTHTGAQPNMIINTMGSDIEDHFRRALGGEEFEAWKRKRDESSCEH